MKIKYNNKIIQNGQFLTPQEASVKPIVTYKVNPTNLYTLIVHDPDAPAGNHLHWVVINIPGLNINKGVEVLSYKRPQPPIKSGTHRYIFQLFQQTQKINKPITFKRIMKEQDVIDNFDNIIDKPLETSYFISKYINKENTKTLGRKNKNTRKTRKRKY